ncbi:hypothetical protein GmHk_18G052250 [Glycine max]|nr:hypothetical protein GmHk_18G052250 [Glycine max]
MDYVVSPLVHSVARFRDVTVKEEKRAKENCSTPGALPHNVQVDLEELDLDTVANFPFPTSLKDSSLLEAKTCLKALENLITRMNFLAPVNFLEYNGVLSI